KFFLSPSFDAKDVSTWDDGLYHLRSAATVYRASDHYDAYHDWVLDHREALYRAGHGRRIRDELRELSELSEETFDRLVLLGKLASEVDRLDDQDESIRLYRQAVKGWQQALVEMPEPLRAEGLPEEEYRQEVNGALAKVRLDLANVLAKFKDSSSAEDEDH